MTDNKQYPYPPQEGMGQATPYPTGPVGFPAYPSQGMANPGYGVPPVGMGGFGGPGQGVGMMGPPPMGFHMPQPSQPMQPPSSDDESRFKYSGGESGYGDINGLDFSEKTIRQAFIKKVYGILSIQVLLTSAIVSVISFHDGVRGFFHQNAWISIPVYIAALAILIVIACCEGVRRKSPHNVILLGLFTVTYGVVIGVITSTYKVNSVAYAAIITAVIVIGLTIFAFQTKIDFTMMGGVLFCCVMVMFIFGFLMLFLPKIAILHKIYACLGALLFSVYLIYDTQLMIGGNHKCSISPEEYVFAALNLYLDIINIFIYILSIFGRD